MDNKKFKIQNVYKKCIFIVLLIGFIVITASCTVIKRDAINLKKEEHKIKIDLSNSENMNNSKNNIQQTDVGDEKPIEVQEPRENQETQINQESEQGQEIPEIQEEITKSKELNIEAITGFTRPFAINFDNKGNIYVTDWGKTHRVMKYDSNFKYLKDIEGEFRKPHAIDFDDKGSIYVSDYGNDRIQKFSPTGKLLGMLGVLSNGKLSQGYVLTPTVEGGSEQGLMKGPATAYFDDEYNLLVSDFRSDSILKFSKEGKFLGWIGVKADGMVNQSWQTSGSPARSAKPGGFNRPHVTVMGKDGNYYITDTWNHRVQKFSKNGKFLGWIGAKEDGTLTSSWEQSGQAVQSSLPGGFHAPVAIDIAKSGDLIITEYGNHRLQKFSINGKFLGWFGGKEDGGITGGWVKEGTAKSGSEPGMLNEPYDLKIHQDKIYIVDTANQRIQIIKLPD